MARGIVRNICAPLNNAVGFAFGVMGTLDFLDGNYGMVLADFILWVAYIALVVLVIIYLEGSPPDETPPPLNQVDTDKDDAA